MPRFYRLCFCSLLGVRPHPVTSAADWERHIQTQEQDRLDELLPVLLLDPSSDISQAPSSLDENSSVEDHLSPGIVRDISSSVDRELESDDPPEPEERPNSDPPSPIANERIYHSSCSPTTDEDCFDPLSPPAPAGQIEESEDSQTEHHPEDWSAEEIPPTDYDVVSPRPLWPHTALRYSTSPPLSQGSNSLEDPASPGLSSVGSYDSGDDDHEEMPVYQDGEVEQGSDHVGGCQNEVAGPYVLSDLSDHGSSDLPNANLSDVSFDEQSFGDNVVDDSDNSQLSNGSTHDKRVGQMRRGFVDEPEPKVASIWDSSGTEEEIGDGYEATSSSEESEEYFAYGRTSGELKSQEIVSIAMHDLKLSHHLSREASTDISDLLKCFSGDTVHCWDYRTTKKWIEAKTGVRAIYYDCCRMSCMSFAMYPIKETCDYCRLPRWKEKLKAKKKVAFATHEYIPIIHRLKLWYADPQRAAAMIKYREKAEAQDNHTDYWTSELFLKLKEKGLFRGKTDLGFLLTTDGVQIYKARAKFTIWPIALKCLNLSPMIRSKRQNILCAGFIPGPKGPKNLDSFLYPLIKEFEELQNGSNAPVLNGSLSNWLPRHDREFILRGHICLIGADMIGREKIMKVTGNRSYCYCEYCLIQGVWNRGIYCPMTAPRDSPIEAQMRKGSGYPWTSWDPQNLPMRSDRDFRLVGKQIARMGASNIQKSKYGIKGLSIFSRLTSIDFPRSFPPDSMHLWFENIVPDLVKQWRGKYKPELGEHDHSGSEADIDDVSTSSDSSQTGLASKKRKAKGKRPNRASKRKKLVPEPGKPAKDPKVVATNDDYNISLVAWETISAQIAASAPNFPSLFGPLLRNFLEYINMMTAAEWQLFTFILGPVYLKGILPDTDYVEFISLVEAIQLSCDYLLTAEDLTDIEQRLFRFSDYYEKRYYRMEWARLRSCLPVFHQILHVPQALRWAGPMYVYSQWAMERLCGTLASTAKSRVSTNQNISNNLIMVEQKNTLVYVIDHGVPNPAEDEDPDGNIQLAKFLTKRLRKSRPLEIGVSSKPKLLFCGPSKLHTMTTYERMCLKAFLFNELVDIEDELYASGIADLSAEADSFNIPTHCRLYRSASYDTCLRGDLYPFKSTSSTAARSNQTRSTSFVRFESSADCNAPHRECAVARFGEVLFYFTVELLGWSGYAKPATSVDMQVRELERGIIRIAGGNELLLAYIRHFPVNRDGKLLYRRSKGVIKVILASEIHELVGLLGKDGREYIVRKDSALF